MIDGDSSLEGAIKRLPAKRCDCDIGRCQSGSKDDSESDAEMQVIS